MPRLSRALVAFAVLSFLTQPLLAGSAPKPSSPPAPAAPVVTAAVAAPVSAPTSAPVAKVGDASISLDQVDAAAAGELRKLRSKEYKLRRDTLDRLIFESMVDQEAKARGITSEALKKAEVEAKIAEPTAEQIEEVYQANRDQVEGMDRAEVDKQIREHLLGMAKAEAESAFSAVLKEKYPSQIFLDPPRVPVTLGKAQPRGPSTAKVVIVEFSEFQCPFCSRAQGTVAELMKQYEGKVQLVFMHYPLAFHQNAMDASQATLCAGEQGKFWEMHDTLFANQNALSRDDLVRYAKDVGLKTKPFKACLEEERYKSQVESDMAEGRRVGVTGTPTFFINGIMLEGAQPLENFSRIIDEELARP